MGIFDRFTSRKGKAAKEKQPRHAVAKKSADDAKRQQFASVPSAGSKPSVDAKAPVASRKENTGSAHRILIRAVVSEKATRLAEGRQYAFVVARQATKLTVKRAIEDLYGIRPERVAIINVQGKWLRYGKSTGQTKSWKKAIVTIPAGKSLTVVGS